MFTKAEIALLKEVLLSAETDAKYAKREVEAHPAYDVHEDYAKEAAMYAAKAKALLAIRAKVYEIEAAAALAAV
jgi:hypothetical protein